MAFYEMLPGAGMPSGLQAGMDSVLNKKFGTSTTYPAEGWPDTVNLMGPLPEKTASGAIVTFSDGADAVPLKKCEITLPASLDGYSSVDVHNTGSNLWDEAWELGAINVVNGQNVANNNFIRSTNYIPVLPNTVYYKCAPQNYLQLYYGKDKTYLSYGSWNKNTTFTTPANCYFVRFYVAQEYGTTYNNDISLNYPSTFTEYAPYSGTTHTASLGRTIHGGTADVVSGQGESSYKIVTVGNSGWNYYSAGGYIYRDFADKVIPEIGDSDHVLVTDNPDMPYGGVNYASQFQDLHIYQANNPAIYIKDTSCTSLNDFYTKYSAMKIGYELATPETFTFDPVPIDSRLGNNTLWSEQGSSTELTYRADINLALGGN